MLKSITLFFETRIVTSVASAKELAENELRIATAALLIEMAHMDDNVKVEELSKVLQILREKFFLTAEDATSLISMVEEERHQATDYYQFTSLINNGFNIDQKIKIIEYLWQVAFIDGELDENEEYLVRKIANLIYVPHKAFIAAKNRVCGKSY